MKKDKSAKEKTFTEGQVAVILEDIRSQQRAIFEGQEFIKSKIVPLETNQAKIWEKLTEIDLRLIKVEKEIVIIKEDIKIIKEDLKVFDKRLVRLEEAPR
jgi:hypothetical protein